MKDKEKKHQHLQLMLKYSLVSSYFPSKYSAVPFVSIENTVNNRCFYSGSDSKYCFTRFMEENKIWKFLFWPNLYLSPKYLIYLNYHLNFSLKKYENLYRMFCFSSLISFLNIKSVVMIRY